MQTQITRRCVIEEETEEYLQKRLLFAMKLFRRLQKAIGKTSFFDGKSLSSTIT